MAYSKSELFSPDLQSCSALFKALAHPARLVILKYLAETKTCITGDLSDELPLGRTTVNQHLKELKDAGLIDGIIEGTRRCYCLNIKNVCALRKMTEGFLESIAIPGTFDCN